MNVRRLRLVLAAAILCMTFGSLALAVPHVFNAGDVVSATEFNENFAALDAAIDNIAVGTLAIGGPFNHGTSATTPTVISMLEFTIDAPSAGTLMLFVSGQVWLDFDSTTTSAVTSYGELAVCNVAATFAANDCGSTVTDYWFQDADNTESNNPTGAFAISRSISVASAGSQTLYVNGANGGGSGTFWLWGPTMVSAVFVPNATPLNITSP